MALAASRTQPLSHKKYHTIIDSCSQDGSYLAELLLSKGYLVRRAASQTYNHARRARCTA